MKTATVKMAHELKITYDKKSTEAACSCGKWFLSVPTVVGVQGTEKTIQANHALHRGLAK